LAGNSNRFLKEVFREPPFGWQKQQVSTRRFQRAAFWLAIATGFYKKFSKSRLLAGSSAE
jgi:hypothetical protein